MRWCGCCFPQIIENTTNPKLDVLRLATLIFDLCHLHYKCTKSVSIPVPLYYADLMAKRGAGLFPPDQADAASQSSGNSGAPLPVGRMLKVTQEQLARLGC